MIDFTHKYAPKKLSDVVFPDAVSEKAIMRYSKGQTRKHLILHGPVGAGKTAIAKLVPRSVFDSIPEAYKENAKGEDITVQGPDIKLVNASSDRSLTAIQKFKDTLKTNPFNYLGMRFFIMDEAEGITEAALLAMRGFLDIDNVKFMVIFTTNDLLKMPAAIKSRCNVVQIGHAPANNWLPRAEWIMEQEGFPTAEKLLLPIIESAEGDNRAILSMLQDVVSDKKELQGVS